MLLDPKAICSSSTKTCSQSSLCFGCANADQQTAACAFSHCLRHPQPEKTAAVISKKFLSAR
jgi:hypothetical protein